MKKIILVLSLFSATLWGSLAFTSDDHDHSNEKETSQSDHKDEHGHEDEHAHEEGHSDDHGDEHGDEHGHEEESGSSVGPDKGITEKAEAGFKLSPEAVKTMGIQTQEFSGGSLLVPVETIVSIKTEKTVFRLRGGWYKRVKIEVASKSAHGIVIKSTSFRDGDQIVLLGAGFLRIAEIFAEEGASHSHAH